VTHRHRILWLLAILVASAGPLFAQGGGASSTGSISGTVVDKSGAVLPGVTVTLSGPALMGVQTTTSSGEGIYRFPAVPPGEYRISYELSGFSRVVRDGIRVALGFNASVNVDMAVKSMEETMTVFGETPTIDATATRVQTNFTKDQLESMPSARDMWSLLADTPAVVLNRFDVGGSTAGTQTTYQAYGYGGQNRPLIEGINTTEGTAAAGFYLDYGSFEEVFIGAAGNSAEMPNPGILTQFVGKSGANRFTGQLYFEYENKDLQSRNVSAEQIASGIRDEDANILSGYKNLNLSLGGPVVKDKLWWYFGYLRQQNEVAQPPSGQIQDGTIFLTKLVNYTGKLTYQMTPRDKVIAYLQYGTKFQPNRTDAAVVGNPIHITAASTLNQESPSWVGKVEYNRTLSDRAFFEIRAGQFGYNFGLVGNSNTPRYEDTTTFAISGGGRDWELRRRRNQLTAALTLFKDNWLGGNHNFKFGGEALNELGDTIWNQGYTDNVVHILRSGAPASVRLWLPSVSKNGLRTYSLFGTDTLAIDRLTLNLGLRFDRYRVFLPAQERPQSRFSPQASTFDEVSSVTAFNHLVPRLGAIYNVAGDGKTVVKLNFGKYFFNPGVNLADSVNPNTSDQYAEYVWNDLNSDRLFQPGEEGALTARQGGTQNAFIDENLTNSYTYEASGWLERELVKNLGLRAGFVWKKDLNGYQRMNVLRPLSAFNVPVSVVDPGPDGRAGTGDDGTIQAFNLMSPAPGTRNVTLNIPEFKASYKTAEVTLTRRFSGRWSMLASLAHTWTDEFSRNYYGNVFASAVNGASLFGANNGAFPNNPNDHTHNVFRTWNAKIYGSYEPGWGLRFTPVLKLQSGQPYGRIVNAALNYGTQAILVEPIGTRKQDNIAIFDIRAERRFKLPRSGSVSAILDVFNVANSNVATNIRWTTGLLTVNGTQIPTFGTPISVLPPRIVRLGVKLDW
jgi:carboxypeptidase family protein